MSLSLTKSFLIITAQWVKTYKITENTQNHNLSFIHIIFFFIYRNNTRKIKRRQLNVWECHQQHHSNKHNVYIYIYVCIYNINGCRCYYIFLSWICIYTYIYITKKMWSCNIYIFMYICIHIHIYIHTYILNTYIYTSMCVLKWYTTILHKLYVYKCMLCIRNFDFWSFKTVLLKNICIHIYIYVCSKE